MKLSTKKKKQLIVIKDWLSKARPDIQANSLRGWQPEFSMLIAVEQIVKYLELCEIEEC